MWLPVSWIMINKSTGGYCNWLQTYFYVVGQLMNNLKETSSGRYDGTGGGGQSAPCYRWQSAFFPEKHNGVIRHQVFCQRFVLFFTPKVTCFVRLQIIGQNRPHGVFLDNPTMVRWSSCIPALPSPHACFTRASTETEGTLWRHTSPISTPPVQSMAASVRAMWRQPICSPRGEKKRRPLAALFIIYTSKCCYLRPETRR